MWFPTVDVTHCIDIETEGEGEHKPEDVAPVIEEIIDSLVDIGDKDPRSGRSDSSSSSSSSAPEHSPHPVHRPVVDVGPRPNGATTAVLTDFGWIAFYKNRNRFEARCPFHKNCCRERTANASKKHLTQGRPLGWLFAWLRAGEFCSAEEHVDTKEAAGHRSHIERLVAREDLGTYDGAAELFAHERHIRPGEGGLEPEDSEDSGT